ncbi:MAG: hypothetical protein HY551_03680 [Elusimicrobia bacterium]|nr:hypothetical protein [Elusimicrobiota bacterium]
MATLRFSSLLALAVAVAAQKASPSGVAKSPNQDKNAAHAQARPPLMLEVPRGTILGVEMVDPVHSGKSETDETFRARVNEGVWVQGRVAIPPGTTLRGTVVEAIPSGRVKGRSKLSLSLQSVELDGKTYALHTDTLTYAGEPHTGKYFGSWLGGALQGALYGVLFGGKEGAVIGAGAGAAAGTAASVMSGKLDVEFPQGAKLMFETMEPVTVPEPPPAPEKPPQAPEPKKDGKAEPAKDAKPSENKPSQPAEPSKETRPAS